MGQSSLLRTICARQIGDKYGIIHYVKRKTAAVIWLLGEYADPLNLSPLNMEKKATLLVFK